MRLLLIVLENNSLLKSSFSPETPSLIAKSSG